MTNNTDPEKIKLFHVATQDWHWRYTVETVSVGTHNDVEIVNNCNNSVITYFA